MEIDVKLATRQSRRLLDIIEQLSNEKKDMAGLISTLTNTIEKQNANIATQNENILRQKEETVQLAKRIEYLELENRHQREIIDAQNRRLFGRRSERG